MRRARAIRISKNRRHVQIVLAKKREIVLKVVLNFVGRERPERAMPMRVQGKLDQLGIQLMELPRAHQSSAVRIPLRAIAGIGRDNEDRRLGAVLLQDGLSVFEIVDIAVVESQEQRTLRQRIAGNEIARVNELKGRPNKIAAAFSRD